MRSYVRIVLVERRWRIGRLGHGSGETELIHRRRGQTPKILILLTIRFAFQIHDRLVGAFKAQASVLKFVDISLYILHVSNCKCTILQYLPAYLLLYRNQEISVRHTVAFVAHQFIHDDQSLAQTQLPLPFPLGSALFT